MAITYHAGRRIQGLSTDVADTPTVNDDLITDKGWDTQGHVGMTYDATNDEVDFNCVADTSHDYALIDLQDADYINGSNISDTAFELRCGWRVDTISNPSANENRATIGLYANNTSNNTAQDIFTLRFSATTGGGQALEMFAKDNAIAVGGSAEYTFTETLSDQTLYLRFNRDGNNFRIRLYSDSNYTTLVEDSGNQSVSGITGLRYFGIKNRGDTQNNGGSTTGAILPNIEIYDGISSTTNKPTNVQVGSRYEETDTRKMYSLTDPLIADDDFTSYADQTAFDNSWVTSNTAKFRGNPTNDNIDILNSNAYDNIYYDLGSVSDTKWLCKFKVTLTTAGSQALGFCYFYVGSTTGDANESNDGLGFYFYDDANNTYALADNGNRPDQTSVTGALGINPSTTTYYAEMKRTSATGFTVTLYSDSSYSTSLGTATLTISSGITGLRYFKIMGYTTSGGLVGTFDDFEFYNNSTDTSKYWQEIGA